ncbi:ORF143 [White spot syndrome virus]|uniref:ORF143 n=1 Tax=White spot syndrome virus TaxID=342409 RepID=A0A2D3I6G3_9VIRU|nr:ORF143 [White spot syndrome virus]
MTGAGVGGKGVVYSPLYELGLWNSWQGILPSLSSFRGAALQPPKTFLAILVCIFSILFIPSDNIMNPFLSN